MSDIHIPIGLCSIKFGNDSINYLADKAEFNAIPTYKKLKKGQFENCYLLEDYSVTFSIFLSEESYKNIQLSSPFLQKASNGLYDNPNKVNLKGLPVIIHPLDSGDSKEYDIVIFNAIVDPENPYTRIYDKGMDRLNVKFIGLPGKSFNNQIFKSYFYIGDWEQAGVLNA
jgi:hypothetical protein